MEESQCNVTGDVSHRTRLNRDLVRINNRPFESPRGRRRGNPGLGRVDGRPFVSQRGRGRLIPLELRSDGSDTVIDDRNGTCPDTFHPGIEQDNESSQQGQPFMASDGRFYKSGLVRIDNKPFESLRGRGRNNPGWGRVDGIPFVSQRGSFAHRRRSGNDYTPSAPTYEDVMDE